MNNFRPARVLALLLLFGVKTAERQAERLSPPAPSLCQCTGTWDCQGGFQQGSLHDPHTVAYRPRGQMVEVTEQAVEPVAGYVDTHPSAIPAAKTACRVRL